MRLPFHLSSDLVLGLLLFVAAVVGYGWVGRTPSNPEVKLAVRITSSSGRTTPVESHFSSLKESEVAAHSPQTGQPVAEVAQASPLVAVAVSAPGNSLQVNDQRVEVSGYQTARNSPGVGLALSISSVEPPHEGELVSSLQSSTSSATPTTSDSPEPSALRRGFTYEEELFRSKWGWAAFGQAQLATRENAADPSAPEIRQRPR